MPFKPTPGEISEAIKLLNRVPAIRLAVEARRYRRYEALLAEEMPFDFKDWHENHPSEHPDVALSVMKSRAAEIDWLRSGLALKAYYLDALDQGFLRVVDVEAYGKAVALYAADPRALERSSRQVQASWANFAVASPRRHTGLMSDAECHLHMALEERALPHEDVKNPIDGLVGVEWFYARAPYCNLEILRLKPVCHGE